MNKKKIYFENLDGLRFLCFLAVYFYHSFLTQYDYIKSSEIYQFVAKTVFGNGHLGVNFFFVLSGFLITYLLIAEKQLNGQINLRNFWIRRILRIWPLFYLIVFYGFFLYPIVKTALGQIPEETASLGYYLTFLNNLDFIQKGVPDASALAVLWSVAIEEQFYLVWPIILYLLPIKKHWMAFSFVIILSLIFRVYNDTDMIHAFHTFSCIGDMAVGAFGAWLVTVRPKFKEFFTHLSPIYILAIYGLFLSIFFFREDIFHNFYFLRIAERFLTAISILMIILEQNYAKNSLFKFSNFKTISKLGVISYGLYCLHMIAIVATALLTKKLNMNTELYQVLVLETCIAFILALIMSKISYKYYEKPFLKLKEKFAYITK